MTTRKMIALAALWAVLGTVNAFAFTPPQWQLQLELLESHTTAYSGVATANYPWTHKPPTGQNLVYVSGNNRAYLETANQVGDLRTLQAAIKANMANLESNTPNATALYNSMVAYGYAGTLSDVQTTLNTTTKAQRIVIIDNLLAQGFYSYTAGLTSTVAGYGKQFARLQPMSGDDCGHWAAVDQAIAFASMMAFALGNIPAGVALGGFAAGSEITRGYECS